MKNKGKKRWQILLSFLMVLLLGTGGVQNALAGSLSEAQKEKENLEKELQEAQELIDGLQDSKTDIEKTVKELDGKLAQIAARLTELENELTQKQIQIDNTQEELTAAQADRQTQYEAMKLRIRFMYENSVSSGMEMLLGAESIADLLNCAEYIARISQYDRNMLVKYEETIAFVSQIETQLAAELADLESMKQQVVAEQEKVTALLNAKEAALAQTEGQINDAVQMAKAYEAEIEAQNEIIAQIQAAEAERLRKQQEEEERRRREEEEARRQAEEEAARQEEEQNKSEDTGSSDGEKGDKDPVPAGQFTWPCPSSRRVTSDYGPRESPTAGASSHHRGIDIGAPYGADIVAAADGTVVFAGYSSAAGNYLTVSHGGGLYTVYMHCSSLVAVDGQSVSRGEVIAKVGSTGISTGNHLHFGVSLNGNYVNPWNYL